MSTPYDTIYFQMDDGCTDLGYNATVDIFIRSDYDIPTGYSDITYTVVEDSTVNPLVITADDPTDKPLDWYTTGTRSSDVYRSVSQGSLSNSVGVTLTAGTNFARSVKVPSFRQNTTVRFSPASNFNGNDSFSFFVRANYSTGQRDSQSTTATIVVLPVNDPPVAVFDPRGISQTYTFNEDTPLALNISYTDVESQNAMLTLTFDEDTLRGSFYLADPGVGQPVRDSASLTNPALNPSPTNSLSRLVSGFTKPLTVGSKFALWYLPRFGENTPSGSPFFKFNWTLTETSGGAEVDYLGNTRLTVGGQIFLNVTPVPDPPFLPSFPLNITLTEDVASLLVLSGKDDYDTDPANISILVSTLPSQEMILKQKTGALIAAASTVVTQDDTISLQGGKDRYGDATRSWFYGTLKYQARDNTNLLSNERVVGVSILPVNDPPVPVCNRKTVMEDDPLYPTGIPIFLESEATGFVDIDTNFANLTFRVKSLLNPNAGELRHYSTNSPVMVNDVVPLIVAPGESVALPWLRVLPRRNWYTNDEVFCPSTPNYPCNMNFSYEVTDKDTNGRNTPSFTVGCGTVEVVVTPVNDRPIGNFVTSPGVEDTPVVLTLSGWDIENDTLQAIVSKLPRKGTLFQYSETSPGVISPLASLQPLAKVGSNWPVTDLSWRVIYMPPKDANSDPAGRVPRLYLTPDDRQFQYFMNEIHTHKNLQAARSDAIFGTLEVQAVNDPPYVFDPMRIGFSSPIALCWSSCDYREDLGQHAPDTAGPIQLYMGGGDVELDPLRLVVTSVECHTQSIFRNKFNQMVVDPTQLNTTATYPLFHEQPSLNPGVLHATLDFRPPQDANSIRFCNVTYTVMDQELWGVDSRTITIDLDPVNDAPRFLEGEDATWTWEQEPKLIQVQGFDVEDQVFTAQIIDCVEGAGTLYLSNPAGDMISEYHCGSRARMDLPGDSTTKAQNWWLLFVPNNDSTPPTEGPTYNRISLFMTDNTSGGQGIFSIKIAVLPLNDPPLIVLLDKSQNIVTQEQFWTGKMEVGYDSDVSLGKTTDGQDLTVHDVDIRSSKYRVTITVTPDAEDLSEQKDSDHGRLSLHFPPSAGAALSVPAGKPALADETILVIGDVVTVTFDAEESVLNRVLSTATLHTAMYKATYTVTLVANDQGRTGGCKPKDDGTYPRSCPQQGSITWTIESSPNNGLSVGQLAGIGLGAAGVFMIAGAGAWRKMRNPPTEDYEPWLFEDADVGVANPLYKDAGLTGANPLYQDTPI